MFRTLKGTYLAPAPIEGARSRDTNIDQLCFVGTGLKQPIMIVTLSADGASKSRADVEAGLIAEMNAVNATLENHEQIGKIIIAKEAWTIEKIGSASCRVRVCKYV